MSRVDPGRFTIVRNYQLAAGQPVRLDDLYDECFLLLENAVIGETQDQVAASVAAGLNISLIQLGPLTRLVGVWAGSGAGGLVTVIGR
jgi:hypothetical protein